MLYAVYVVSYMICKTIHHENVEINDPGILALIDDLGLVPGRRPPFFCELYKQMVAMRERRKREEDSELMRLYHNYYKRGRRPIYGVLEKQLTLF